MLGRLVRRLRRQSAPATIPRVTGSCDGISGDILHGWAWLPDMPHARLEVEQWVNGMLVARTLANMPRGDLAAAGLGDGSYGWRMPVTLDPAKLGPQTIEMRVRDGAVLPAGTLVLCNAFVPPDGAPDAAGAVRAQGHCDARDGVMLRGWAWRPDVPEQRVVVEQWVDGVLAAHAVADQPRADLFDANMGDGSYGWAMPLTLDMSRTGLQNIALRIRGAGVLSKGRFVLTAADSAQTRSALQSDGAPEAIVGRCDGVKGAALYGWARNLSAPDESVEVELWVDGAAVASTQANIFRPDLRGNQIGHGRYAWRLPIELPPPGHTASILVRAKDGPTLTGGAFELRNDLELDDPANAALRLFVEAVLNPAAGHEAPRHIMSLLYCPAPSQSGKFWACDYDDYAAAMRRLAPALAQLGAVEIVDGMAAATTICAERRGQGWDCTLYYFGSPRHAPLLAPCRIVPVFAWAFPGLPTGMWDGDPRSDWRSVLRFAGCALTFSRFAAHAVQAAMGTDFPVAAVLPPLRTPGAQAAAPPAWQRTIRLRGIVFDSRDYKFSPENTYVAPAVWDGGDQVETGQDIGIAGVLVTSFLDFLDGRKNCEDLVRAFTTAHQDNAHAVLLLKLTEMNGEWVKRLHGWLTAQPPFRCRVLAVRGQLDEQEYDAIIAASHWYASAASAEGLCLPMQDFLAAGRPAIAPVHTAMADYLTASNALIVASQEEPWTWPRPPPPECWSWTQHPDDVGPTTAHAVSWPGLVNALCQAYTLPTAAPDDYAAMAAAARDGVAAACGKSVAAGAVEWLLAQNGGAGARGPSPSPLLRELAGE